MNKEDLEEAWQILTDREKTIISSRFGLKNGKPETLEAVGKRLGFTRERIRQLQNHALSQLRRAKRDLDKFGEVRISMTRETPAGNPKKLKWDRKRIKQIKVAIKPRPPEQTDAVRLDWLESEIKDRSLYIAWIHSTEWKLDYKGETLYASNLRRLIDTAIHKLEHKKCA